MNEVKNSSQGSSSSNSVESVAGSLVTRAWNPKLPNDFYAGLFTVAVVSLMIVMSIKDTVKTSLFDDIKRLIMHPWDPPLEADMPQHWNYSSHEFVPVISDWDEHRLRWMEADPNFNTQNGAKPRVLMVTGSSQDEGELYILSHLLLRAGKNKHDYTQTHNMQLYYNMINPDPEFSDWWVKLPVVRMLMLRHPEVEWIWWMDADAVITDMAFEPPFAKLERCNLVLYGEDRPDHDKLDPTGLSIGVFMIRNCQWSLDLLGAWAETGKDSKREEAGDVTVQGQMEVNRFMDVVPGDDRSSLFALLAQDRRNPPADQKWVPKVKLVEGTEYVMNGNWTVVGPKFEELSLDNVHELPFVAHFEGCLPHPSEVPQLSRQESEDFNDCVEQLERAFDLAENQVYKELGLERNTLGNSSEPFTWKVAPQEELTEAEFSIFPIVTGWDETRKAYMDSKPGIAKEMVVILSGSPPTPCTEKEGSHLLVRGLKNKIDYSRVHGIRMFYNMAILHKTLTWTLTEWFAKLPVLKVMIISSPDVEWLWWTDSDAVFTSMDFKIPFERYNANGYNLVLWGDEHEVFDLKKYNGISTGVMFIRNCQWSLDLLDRWAASANLTGDFLGTFLDRPPMELADDQSILVYLLLTEREKWASKVYFETDIVLSGEWYYWSTLFVDEYKMRADERPLMTHFAGCSPCEEKVGTELCLERLDRTYNFADNQVLGNYGLSHERLNSSRISCDFRGDAQVWTHFEIEGMVNESAEELSASDKEVDPTKEEVTVMSNKEEEENVEPTNEHEEVPENNEEQLQVEPSNEQEEMAEDEEQQVEPTKEQEQVTETEEETVEPTNEQDEMNTTKEEEQVTSTNKDEQVTTANEKEKEEQKEVLTKEQGAGQSKENLVDSREEKGDTPEESEPGKEITEGLEASNTEVQVGKNT